MSEYSYHVFQVLLGNLSNTRSAFGKRRERENENYLGDCMRASLRGPDWSSAQRRVQTLTVKSNPSEQNRAALGTSLCSCSIHLNDAAAISISLSLSPSPLFLNGMSERRGSQLEVFFFFENKSIGSWKSYFMPREYGLYIQSDSDKPSCFVGAVRL